MRTKYEWRVIFEDETILDEYNQEDDLTRSLFEVFDKSAEARITQIQWIERETGEWKLSIPIDEGQKPIIRHRNQIHFNLSDGKTGESKYYLLGKHWNDRGQNKQVLMVMTEAGQVIGLDRWRKDNSLFHPAKLLTEEMLDE